MRARVVLTGARTYTLGGRRWIKDVPGLVVDDEVKLYQQNGYFRVHVLQSKSEKPEAGAKVSAKSKKLKGSKLRKA